MKSSNMVKGRKGQKGKQSKHDIAFKRRVAQQYLNGDQSTTQLAQVFNIPHQTVSLWARQFSNELATEITIDVMNEQEQRDLCVLQKEVAALKKKLEYEQMRNFALETMVDLAKTELGIDLRKNSGAKQPKE